MRIEKGGSTWSGGGRSGGRHSKYKGGFMLSDPTKDRSVGWGWSWGRARARASTRSLPSSLQYNKRRRFSKETRYRTRVRFTITYPSRSRQLWRSNNRGFRAPILAPSSNGTRISSVARETKANQRKTRSLARRSCFFQRGLFGRTERLPLSRRRR